MSSADLPVISLVTPNLNLGDCLEATIRSVLAQDYPRLEYIVVDGGSIDRSLEIVDTYRSRITKVIIEPDGGHGEALRKGFAASTGRIMGWINSDDILMPGALQVVSTVFSTFDYLHWIQGNHTHVTERGIVSRSALARPMSRIRMLAGDYRWIQQESTFWTRDLWEAAGATVGAQAELALDLELWLRFFRHTRLYNVEGAIGAFRLRAGQRSVKNAAAYQREAHQLLGREAATLSAKYLSIFRSILPEAPRTLSPSEVQALPEKVVTQDLLPVRLDRDGRYVDPNPPETRRPVGHGGPSPTKPFAALRGRHRGERLFIMGNGPSLNRTRLDLLRDEIVFGCNACFLLFDRIDWRPAYYCCVDTRVLPDRASDILAMHAAHPEMVLFFPELLRTYDGSGSSMRTETLLPSAPGRHFFKDRGFDPQGPQRSIFSTDMDDGLVLPETVTITMLQIGCHLGFREIVLIGCDTRYSIPASVVQSGPQVDEGGQLFLLSAQDDDPNHFDPRYFGKGRPWHHPKVDRMLMHYALSRDILAAAGVTVRNATVGGDLDVFPRVEFESLF